MNILISGASGFIGQHLVRLLAVDHSIYGITRKKKCLEPQATSVVVDLADQGWTRLLPGNIDCVIHLAQSLRYRDFPEGVADMQRINIDATVEILEWARQAGVQQFVYTSTANVYAPSAHLLVETSPAIPNSFYGASKLAAEHLARQYQKYFQVNILRLFTVFGPKQKNMLIANVIERIKKGQEITLAKGAGIYLTPVFVGDVANIIKRLITIPAERESLLMNVCGEHVVSLCEIVNILESLQEKSAVIRNTKEEEVFVIGNNARLRESICDYRFLDIKSGLERTLNFKS